MKVQEEQRFVLDKPQCTRKTVQSDKYIICLQDSGFDVGTSNILRHLMKRLVDHIF